MKLFSLAIIALSFAAAGFAIKHEANVASAPAVAARAEIEQERQLPTRRTIREDAIIKKMDNIEHDLLYLKGRINADR